MAVINGTAGDDTLTGTGNPDDINGLSGNDTIYGGADDDLIQGAGGSDTLYGGAGDDELFVDVTTDIVIEYANEGHDFIRAGCDYTVPDNVEDLFLAGSARIGTGNSMNNTMYGSGGADTILGLDGNDVLRGKSGRDDMFGGDGDDLIDGGEGADTMTGGAGGDDYKFDDGDYSANHGTADQITDMVRGEDRINLFLIDANTTIAGNQVFTWIGSGAFGGNAGELRYDNYSVPGETLILGDMNGDGATDLQIICTGAYAFIANDFVL